MLSLNVPLVGVEAQIYNDLWNAVINRKLKPGVKLEEAVLCELYGISRTVVRKVLVIMEQAGIVHLPVNRGAYIAKPTAGEAENLVEGMHLLLTHFARELANAPDQRRAEVHKVLSVHLQAEQQASQQAEFNTLRRLRLEAGTLLGVLAGNRLLTESYERFATRLTLALALYQRGSLITEGHSLMESTAKHILAGEPDEAAATFDTAFDMLRRSLDFGVNEDVDLKA
ncbi:GntR family transcriptional regulator, partial [Neorhizobium sp. T786]|uniref:GntR family transcriptional regulator n=1 Tax=Pseudorhizobium xiangyangii TaxID=2883104 RepID=UPI001D0018F7